ncbi:AsnC family transcriptional regulator [Microbacterium sp. ZW T5_56]|uniref:AsnC family transcriptional regulator n=1 Tax=Microbacterium sp. ZW T5_56 TaxID=3378081 RepID=UPI00385558E8
MDDVHGVVPRSLDEIDLAVLHALQIDARAPWTRIAAVIGVDAATVVRHWSALRADGLAWLTAWPTPQRWSSTTDLGIVLLDSRTPGDALAAVVQRPWVLSVDETSAGYLALVATSAGLARLGDRARELSDDGAPVLRMDVAASIVAEDSTWRLAVLSAAQQRSLRAGGPADAAAGVARQAAVGQTAMGSAAAVKPVAGTRPIAAATVAEIAAALDEDPRMPAATLAVRLGVSEATARRTLERVTAAGLLRFGCDLAMPAAGFRRGVVLWGRSDDPEGAATRAVRLPEVHRAGILVGAAPLFVCLRARSLTALPAVERSWGADVEITDRWTVLRSMKRNGHVLDADGRSVARVAPSW